MKILVTGTVEFMGFHLLKKLIVTVSFLTALILSIFIVFFIQFIKSFKEEEKIK